MSNNSSSSSSNSFGGGCDLKWYSRIGSELELPIYYVLYPTCLFLGFVGRIACFFGFYKHSKKEPAYFYQVSLTVGELFELVTCTGYNMVMICGWNLDKNAAWCLSNYSYLWYEAHLAVPLMNMAGMVKNLQAIFMAADRVVGLGKPVLYQTFQQKWLHVGSIIVSVIIGVSTSVFDYYRYRDPQQRRGGSSYTVSVNFAFLESTTAITLSRLRDAMRFGELIILIGLNVAIVRIFLKQKKKMDAILGQTVEARKQRRKARGDNSLLLLTLSQCFFTSITMIAVVIYYSVLAIKPTFDQCEASLWGPLLDGLGRVCEVGEFALIMIFSRYFRRIIFGALPTFKSGSVSNHSHQLVQFGGIN